MFFTAIYGVRIRGRDNEPASGGVLVMSNHQSHLDPVLVGLSLRRRLNFLARDTLFRFAPFRWLILSLDTIALDREGVGLSGLKETLRRLKRGEMVLMFPEGTRSRDGQIAPLKPGFCAIARRAKVPMLPIAIEGAYAAWPRRRLLPRRSVINIQIGSPLRPEDIATLSDEQLVAQVQQRMESCHAAASEALHRAIRTSPSAA
jgi:1-acyl-sn-glycerol-3-phosphate acyltransferase